ncbi:MAG: hypothetical protein HC901_04600 [Bdellovibrionaceae bacterium]|nr:hypothetical protein [Pseudobdellovibrionaceae bacterium]
MPSTAEGEGSDNWEAGGSVPFGELVWRGFALSLPLILVLGAIAIAILYSLRK